MLPGGRDLVPEHLRHYLEGQVTPSAWYPERDYEVLIQALASLIPPDSVGGDVWAYFGRTAAQRDLVGSEDRVAEAARINDVGAYRKLAQGVRGGVANLALRAMKLWSLYHDTGTLTVERSRDDDQAMVLRILSFDFPVRGLIDMQTAYFLEFARLGGVRLDGRLRRATTDGDPFCEWEFSVERTPDNLASLAQLPLDTR
jgi:hypothetical protein